MLKDLTQNKYIISSNISRQNLLSFSSYDRNSFSWSKHTSSTLKEINSQNIISLCLFPCLSLLLDDWSSASFPTSSFPCLTFLYCSFLAGLFSYGVLWWFCFSMLHHSSVKLFQPPLLSRKICNSILLAGLCMDSSRSLSAQFLHSLRKSAPVITLLLCSRHFTRKLIWDRLSFFRSISLPLLPAVLTSGRWKNFCVFFQLRIQTFVKSQTYCHQQDHWTEAEW